MEHSSSFDVGIVGGGIAGLISSYLLSQEGLSVILFEAKTYPLHKVCGEYVSNETVPFLKKHGLFPEEFNPPSISRFQLTDTSGKSSTMDLDLGGFGISRYQWDRHLYQQSVSAGTTVLLETRVTDLKFENDAFKVETTGSKAYDCKVVLGAQGKRSIIDKKLNRKFISKRHPYVGVKYHARGEFPNDLVSLHNFSGGYCGVNAVEDGLINVCYLSHRSNFRDHGSIEAVNDKVLRKNPLLAGILDRLEPVFEKPLVINEITFDTKEPVDSHVLMCGDAAGMITPLCGNGMAMAVRSAKILSETILRNWDSFDRRKLEREYTSNWNSNFRSRLMVGRQIQKLFGSNAMSSFAVSLANGSSFVTEKLIGLTHGKLMD